MTNNFNKRFIFFLLIIVLSISLISSQVYSQIIYTQKDVEICNSKFKVAIEKNLSLKPINEIVLEIAKTFIGTEYEAHTLDKENEEKLIVHLTGLDCYTFLESSIVFARCIKKGLIEFQDYIKELENIRYRDGKLNDYSSRLHYFSDWIYDMDKRKIGKDITKEIGGKPYKKRINFMSTHLDSYPQLQKNKELIKQIRKIEENISERNYYYIPEDDIEKIENKINDGDIIGITTNIEGLDIAHTGIAIKQNDGRVYLLHAPNVGYKVQITEKPLADYIKSNKKQSGIMILRLMEIQ
ncbi:N-acetylmuramoyl-L-alanine amidase-like domain-containing protein [Rosettibacter firmus]|uniref:N-acetylmuramoyl-L-alanine amidase-like domain-containing protein n=1 Tax=Rosettibacter firmus TaxID=3111522 RepID=UPI00336BD247